MHPDYLSTTFARDVSEQLQIPLLKVQHHHAHIASAMAEHHLDEEVIGISLDGTGYGPDGNMWGGEFFITNLCDFKRYSHFDYIAMPGGDKAISEPWRMAMSYIYKYFGKDDLLTSIPWSNNMDIGKKRLIYEMIEKKINSPLTSSAGRLFDAVAALLGLCVVQTFEAEAPMRLESIICHDIKDYYPYHIDQTVILKEMFQGIIRDINNIDKSIISVKFHNTIAKIIVDVSEKIRREDGLKKVVLSGGVFQNRYLIETSIFLLKQSGFDVYINNLVPANDGGISLGQLVIAAKKQKLCV
jgi:hydrogenase maturation protein HypF